MLGSNVEFVLRKDENYYQQVFLKECKYIEREKKTIRYITDDLEVSTYDFCWKIE